MSVPIATAVVNEIRISLPVAVSGPVVDTPTLTITPALGVVHIATTVRKFVASPTPLWSTLTPSPTVVPMVAPTPVPTPDLAVARRIGTFDWRSYETDGYVFDRVDDGDRILLRSIDANTDGFDFVECSSAFGVSFSSSENPTFRMGSRFVWVWGIGFSGQGECWRVVVDKDWFSTLPSLEVGSSGEIDALRARGYGRTAGFLFGRSPRYELYYAAFGQ